MAATFRLVYFPPTFLHPSNSYGTYTHQFSCPSQTQTQTHHRYTTSPFSLSTSNFLSQRTQRPKRSNYYLFHVASSAGAQPVVQELTPESQMVQDNDEDDNEEEEDNSSNSRLLAQNVPWTCTADDLRPLFEQYGTVVEIESPLHNKTRNRGLVFVTMASHEEAVAALTNLESKEFQGRALKLNWARPKKSKPSTPSTRKPVPVHNLFVANFPFKARANDLKEFFNANDANVVSAEVIFHDNPRRSAGYGFVSFNTKEEAEAALKAFDGKKFMGRAIRVARSKRFLRQGTKESIQSADAKTESNPTE